MGDFSALSSSYCVGGHLVPWSEVLYFKGLQKLMSAGSGRAGSQGAKMGLFWE